MSGSSLDGLDLAAVRFERSPKGDYAYELLVGECVPYDEERRQQLEGLATASAFDLAHAHAEYARFLGQTLAAFLERNELKPDFVALHGHTVFHQPELGVTFQLGDGEGVAAFCPCPVITNFRSRDVALGGQGAPLVPKGESELFPDFDLFLNLGGIVNLGAREAAFDICVGNQALNALAGRLESPLAYDRDGLLAASGRVDPALLALLRDNPWYQRPPPKSLGREWFDANLKELLAEYDGTVADGLATYVEHVVQEVVRGVRPNSRRGDRCLITGGGWHNHHLRERLCAALDGEGVRVEASVSDLLVDYKEALIFAFLGVLALQGEPNILAGKTGARIASVAGCIHPTRRFQYSISTIPGQSGTGEGTRS